MTLLSKEAMTRPLFEEPGPHIERPDEFSAPHGFLFGVQSGMGGSPDSLDLAQDYMEAAVVLTDAIMKDDWPDHRLADPLMYLYRHAIELFLKGVMDLDAKHHDLAKLADAFAVFVRQRYKTEVPSWITERIKEIAAIDRRSTAFRYGLTYDPKTKRDLPVSGEYYVSLPHLRDSMIALNWAIASVIGDISTDRIETLARCHAQRQYFSDEAAVDDRS